MIHNKHDWLASLLREKIRESGKALDSKQQSKLIGDVIQRIVPKFSEVLLKSLKSKMATVLEESRVCQSQFEERLVKRWKRPFDLLEFFLILCREAGSEFNSKYRTEANRTHDYVFVVLTRLHARGCQTACEILALLKSGLADGAHARWRTLHEIATISFFIKDHGQQVAERYLHYTTVETYKEAHEYQKHYRELGDEPLTEKALETIKKRRDQALKVYGEDFCDDYGWIPKEILKKRNFSEIEKSVKLDRLRPYYKWACHNVHSGPTSLVFRLGLIKTMASSILLAGRSNYGLADPGQGAAISLCQITICLLSTRPTIENLVIIKTIEKLVDEINPLFCDVQKEIEKEERAK